MSRKRGRPPKKEIVEKDEVCSISVLPLGECFFLENKYVFDALIPGNSSDLGFGYVWCDMHIVYRFQEPSDDDMVEGVLGDGTRIEHPVPEGMDPNALHCVCQKPYNPYK